MIGADDDMERSFRKDRDLEMDCFIVSPELEGNVGVEPDNVHNFSTKESQRPILLGCIALPRDRSTFLWTVSIGCVDPTRKQIIRMTIYRWATLGTADVSEARTYRKFKMLGHLNCIECYR
jgi:hypothetical protein